ncbi:RNA ligase family protein [Paraflavitalea sp. CAU 1676]|uniref:RNA ligase family protein n=1 Tax=Paraflavitalea sp. CAU 1676 TaxID=3032598 RepID=UPI0023D9951D|nr:RNA ligase family protein [Paraflavitalea sp. CAU 1676]MDF2189299.1 RNA ligase family protein [Paraflavitalea sp. CAU 1676]
MNEKVKFEKPLGYKAYGSIPHLPGSRLGSGDHHCEHGQARIATEKTRDRHDVVIVQEKLDGSNVCVARVKDGAIQALTRAGYPALSSPYEQHIMFSQWVKANIERFDRLLGDNERICGEWLVQAHGTRYDLPHEPFVPFDVFKNKVRLPYMEFESRVKGFDFTVPKLLSYGPAYSIEAACEAIKVSGHGALDPVEGAIWRVERRGKVDFLTKFVHHFKQDGNYLPEKNGTDKPIYNVYF